MKNFGLALLVVAAGLLAVWFRAAAGGNDQLQVYFLNVGQGDAIYARAPGGQDILIDGGPDNSVLAELGTAMPFWDRTIEIMVLTHPHADHVTGLVEVLRRYRVEKVFLSGVLHNTPDYLAFLKEINDQGISTVAVTRPTTVDLGSQTKLEFLFPDTDLSLAATENLNNTSLVAKLSYGETDFLLMGDAEQPVEQHLLDSGANLSAEILKVGHHGSRSSSSEEFLQLIEPRAAVIEVGCDNSFGHPHAATLEKLTQVGAEVLTTCEQGTIRFYSDGHSYAH